MIFCFSFINFLLIISIISSIALLSFFLIVSKFADIFRKYPDVFNAVGAIITKWISSTN
nr:MAG TPA: hypothetical protein [Caudoviricetes sp.]